MSRNEAFLVIRNDLVRMGWILDGAETLVNEHVNLTTSDIPDFFHRLTEIETGVKILRERMRRALALAPIAR